MNKNVRILVALHAAVDQPLHGCADSLVYDLAVFGDQPLQAFFPFPLASHSRLRA